MKLKSKLFVTAEDDRGRKGPAAAGMCSDPCPMCMCAWRPFWTAVPCMPCVVFCTFSVKLHALTYAYAYPKSFELELNGRAWDTCHLWLEFLRPKSLQCVFGGSGTVYRSGIGPAVQNSCTKYHHIFLVTLSVVLRSAFSGDGPCIFAPSLHAGDRLCLLAWRAFRCAAAMCSRGKP
jgi:hypothetical protein